MTDLRTVRLSGARPELRTDHHLPVPSQQHLAASGRAPHRQRQPAGHALYQELGFRSAERQGRYRQVCRSSCEPGSYQGSPTARGRDLVLIEGDQRVDLSDSAQVGHCRRRTQTYVLSQYAASCE
jgi:hypothetical protein